MKYDYTIEVLRARLVAMERFVKYKGVAGIESTEAQERVDELAAAIKVLEEA
jgi:hypothetical protein